MKIYLAAPIFKPEQLAVVEAMKLFAEQEHLEVFSPYHNSQAIWRGRAPKDCEPWERAMVLTDNIRHLDWCDYLVAWVGGMGGFTDPGVVWEMGYGYKAGKLTLAYLDETDDRPNMNLMLAGTVDAVARGKNQLAEALALLAARDLHEVRFQFNPDKQIGQEKEPVV